MDVEPRDERLARWLAEAERFDVDVRRQFAAVLDQDSKEPAMLDAGDVWPCVSLPPMTAHLVGRREIRAFTSFQVLGHRGPLMIASTKGPFTPGCEHGSAVAVVNVTGELPMSHDYLAALGMTTWDNRLRRCRVVFFDSARSIEPFRVRGEPGIFRVMVPR